MKRFVLQHCTKDKFLSRQKGEVLIICNEEDKINYTPRNKRREDKTADTCVLLCFN